jgi:tetratricopeptide (TPR) repeat protein
MGCWARTVSLGAAFLTVAALAFAQHEHHAERVGYVPREVLDKPVPLRRHIGTVNDRITSSSPDAQAFYNQGVAYLHSYVWVEAARSFNQALRHDPNVAMIYVGLSRAFSGLDDDQAARMAIDRASGLAAAASPREQRRVAIRKLQLDAMADVADVIKLVALKRAIDEALAKDFEDVELWLIRGNAEETTAAGRGQRGGAASIAFYERVLKIDPENFAAHHYLIHSYESIGDIPAALRHGAIYARAAANVPHARHMYGHDLRRVGRIGEAIAEFGKADELERAYYATEGVSADFDWHHQHNLDLLSTSYEYLGQMKAAERLMREAFAIPSVDGSREYQKRDWIGYLLKRGRLDDALQAAESLRQSTRPAGRLTGHIGAARVLMARGRTEEARAALADAEREQQALPVVPSGVSLSRAMVEPEIVLARAELLLRTGDAAKGRTLVQETIARLRAQLGPDAWSQALFRMEGLGQVARSLGDWELAELVGRQMLAHDQNYAGAHYAIALVAEQKGDRAVATQAYALAAKLWADADPDFEEAISARGKASARARVP